jgi:gas vesicle protein
MTSDSRINGFGWYLGAFVLGAAAGATIAILTAPRSGSETRERLKSATLDMKKKMENVPGAFRRAVAESLKAGQAVLEQARDEVSEFRMPPTDGSSVR